MRLQFFATMLLAAVTACRNAPSGEDQRTDSVTSDEIRAARADWPSGVSELVDSANAAYAANDFARASELYRRAADRGPRLPAVWFGIYMAEHARGNKAAADSAVLRVQELAPGASLIQPAPVDSQRSNSHR